MCQAHESGEALCGGLLYFVEHMSANGNGENLAPLANLLDARRTKRGGKLKRYLRQTEAILKIVPRRVNPPLWDAIMRELGNA